MMQHATFKVRLIRYSRVLAIALFVVTLVLPLNRVHADSFGCTASLVGVDIARLTIASNTEAYRMSGVTVYLLQGKTTGAASTDLIDAYNVFDTPDGKAVIYAFQSLKAATPYRVVVLDANHKYIEDITSCAFTTRTDQEAVPATTTTTKTVTPSTTTTTTPAAPVVSSTASTGSGLIPCDGPDCNLNSVMQLANNLLSFFFKTLLLPLFVIMVIYLGYSYIAAQGKPGQHAKLGSMAKKMVLGLLLMLCAWVIVRTLLFALGYHDDLFFFAN
ncbi:MAG: hypothetical protein JWL92_640 [Candidatus Nomurabacteria bacterium]|nr:hypothetical protein [Candidatus Nomurabacteria bacterium]